MGWERNFCILCGHDILLPHSLDRRSWSRDFRIVYSDLLEFAVSGVGRLRRSDPGTWPVSPCQSRRWDDVDYNPDLEEEFEVMGSTWTRGHRHGFLLHDACWELLQVASRAESLSLERLFNVCHSLPFPVNVSVADWSHSYLGLVYRDDVSAYPYDERPRNRERSDEFDQIVRSDPYGIAEISTFWTERGDESPYDALRQTFRPDYFTHFPLETLSLIMSMLPTCDALNLRLVSPAFHAIFENQQFWRTRFLPGAELEFLFEDNQTLSRDWRNAFRNYHRNVDVVPGLKNRKRIWRLIGWLKLHLNLRLGPNQDNNISDTQDLSWSRAAAHIEREWEQYGGWNNDVYTGIPFLSGCRHFTTFSAVVPAQLKQICISVLQLENVTYITGLRLIGACPVDNESHLGYTVGAKQLVCYVTCFAGLVLAVGNRGIHALRIVHGNDTISEWYGDPIGMAVTERLRFDASVYALKVELDGYKIAAISVASSSSNSNDSSTTQKKCFRKNMMWYPSYPSWDLDLNETSFYGIPPLLRDYRPMTWFCFGGEDGTLLSRLIKVSFPSSRGISGIGFHYEGDADDKADRRMRLGRVPYTEQSRYRIDEFAIDGSNGERITAIAVAHSWESAPELHYCGSLSYMEISTNWNRSDSFGTRPPDSTLRKLEVTPGTVIVGFYGSHNATHGMQDLGLISIPQPSPKAIAN